MLMRFLGVYGSTLAGLLAGALLLHLIPRLGSAGRKLSAALCRAPGLDIPITYFTVLPLFVGPIVAGWVGFVAAVAAQVSTVLLWSYLHGLAHPEAMKGPRIVKTLNRTVGKWRNYGALWATAIVTPMFWVVRMAEVFVYPMLTALIHLPKYNHAEWVNVSRQKFEGLVGHDRIWCLYCDWMTGVWSLGSEMLRNVESFWCPIRFGDVTKCANCAIDFPDVKHDWVPADAKMADVTAKLETMYTSAPGPRPWFGHPIRLTVAGRDPSGNGATATKAEAERTATRS